MKRRWWLVLAGVVAACGVAAGVLLASSGSGGLSHQARVTACTRVLQQRMDQAMQSGSSPAAQGKPAECNGLSSVELKRIAGKIIAREMRSGLKKMFGG
jgi:hypothetical protein